MKLLLILLPFGLVWHSQAKGISPETRAELKKQLGVDPELRKARFQKISEKAAKQLEEEQEVTINSRFSEELPIVHIDEPIGKNSLSIAELNKREGIAEYLFEGDMILTEEQMAELEREVESGGRRKRQASTYSKKWTDNTVNFYFDSSISQRKKDVVREAHKYIQSRTCIKFVEDSTAKNRVMVFNGTGCNSAVGMKGGEQSLSLGEGCQSVGTAAHEFIHALGFQHEQSRADRNNYITVNEGNIENGRQHNFMKLWYIHDDSYTPYEYGSVMHYSADSFAKSKNDLTMVSKDKNYLFTMGHRQVTFYDIQMLNEHYGCTANCNAQTSAKCKNGGVPNPSDCSKCNCPAGYAGDFCDQRPAGCGEALRATKEWQRAFLRVGENGLKEAKINYDYCTSWITAPEGKTIEVQINNIIGSSCNYGCMFNGFEVKGDSDTRKTNPVYCCKEFLDTIVTSSLNPTPVRAYSNYGQAAFLFLYRYVDQPAPTTSAPVTQKTCEDVSPIECQDYVKRAGSCKGILDRKAKEYCAKSCGYCDGPVPSGCEDKEPTACSQMAQLGITCEQLQSSSHAGSCDKTCGLCGAPKTTVAPTTTRKTTTAAPCEDAQPKPCGMWFNAGRTCEELQNSRYSGLCNKSCRLCGSAVPTTTRTPPCEDKEPAECAAFNQQYGCDKLPPAVAQQTCAKTCGQCGAPKPTAPCVDRDPNYCARSVKNGKCDALEFKIAAAICPKSCGLCV